MINFVKYNCEISKYAIALKKAIYIFPTGQNNKNLHESSCLINIPADKLCCIAFY